MFNRIFALAFNKPDVPCWDSWHSKDQTNNASGLDKKPTACSKSMDDRT